MRILRAYILDDPFFCKPSKPLGDGKATEEEEQEIADVDTDKLGMSPPASPEPLAAEALSDEETDEIMAIEKVDHKEAEARKGREITFAYIPYSGKSSLDYEYLRRCTSESCELSHAVVFMHLFYDATT